MCFYARQFINQEVLHVQQYPNDGNIKQSAKRQMQIRQLVRYNKKKFHTFHIFKCLANRLTLNSRNENWVEIHLGSNNCRYRPNKDQIEEQSAIASAN